MEKMNAIPTRFAGTNFRSRLEARWAAMFDLCGWSWEYEPVDYDGWIPDFLLFGKGDPIAVEVKPHFHADELTQKKIDASGCQYEVLLLGPFVQKGHDFDALTSGWFREYRGDESTQNCGWWQDMIWSADDNQNVDFHPCDGGWNLRLSQYYDGNRSAFRSGEEQIAGKIIQSWREAGNIAQWKKYTSY